MSLPWEEGGFLEVNCVLRWLETTYLHKEARVNCVSIARAAQRKPSSSLSPCSVRSSQMPVAALTSPCARGGVKGKTERLETVVEYLPCAKFYAAHTQAGGGAHMTNQPEATSDL